MATVDGVAAFSGLACTRGSCSELGQCSAPAQVSAALAVSMQRQRPASRQHKISIPALPSAEPTLIVLLVAAVQGLMLHHGRELQPVRG